MATLEWTCEAVEGVTLVQLVVTGERSQRIRIESNLTPVWPPRRQGRPAAGWNDSTFEGHLEDDNRLAVGYASPAEPVEPPAELMSVPPNEDDEIDPRDVIRALGDGTPPRDAVPSGQSESSAGPTDVQTGSAEFAKASPEPSQSDYVTNRETGPSVVPSAVSAESTATLPPAIEAYFDALDRRIATAEQLADSTRVDQAQEAVTATGGIEAVAGLRRRLRADRLRLDRLEQRYQSLANRLDTLEIPVEQLGRLT
jgi:hypothetical protein